MPRPPRARRRRLGRWSRLWGNIKYLKHEIAKLRQEHHGHSWERRARLIDQTEIQLEERETAATWDEIAAGKLAKTTTASSFERRCPARKPFPEHLPRERVVIEAPTDCSCSGSDRIVKTGGDITEMFEVIPPAVEGDRPERTASGYGICSPATACRWLFHKGGRVEEVRAAGRFRSNDWKALLHAAIEGYGVTLGPADVRRAEIEAGRLVQVLPGHQGPSWPMNLLIPAGRRPTAKIRSFVTAVTEAFGAEAQP